MQSPYLSPEQVCELLPGLTVGNLAQLRKNGKGPRYRKPTGREAGKLVLYRYDEVIAWVEEAVVPTRDQP